MCGRIELDLEISNPAMLRITELLKEQFPNERITSGEKYPSDLLPILTAGHDKPELTIMRWGFLESGKSKMVINARSETVSEKPMFKESFSFRRCILPTTGFYEWSHDELKTKYLFRLMDNVMVYLAGLYKQYEDGLRFVILTQEANRSIAEIHNRMPVIIKQNEITSWLINNEFASTILTRTGPRLVKAIF
jgi:putative SOS response-associated peptidase YedK